MTELSKLDEAVEIAEQKEKDEMKKGFKMMVEYFGVAFGCLAEHTIRGNTKLAIQQMHELLGIIEERDPILANEMKEQLIEYREKHKKNSNLIDPTKGMDGKKKKK